MIFNIMENSKVKIGLEIHGYLKTKEKLFCNCKALRHSKKQDVKPNTNICPICAGYPGSKPMLPNKEAIKKVIQIGLMLGCNTNTIDDGEKLIWNRKHYRWPDLPKGYQNTISGAYSIPVVEDGKFEGVRIREAHLEEDPAQWDPKSGNIDYNRSGLPLIEIVTEPDFSNCEEVEKWINELLITLSYIRAIDKNAGIKADVNISTGGERVEIKNVSSINDIKNAINYEIKRQSKRNVERETRRYDNSLGKTISMRKKEEEADYQFIPDPDLPVLKITDKEVYRLKKELPESPKEKLEKLIKKHKINKEQAEILRRNFELVEFFEKVAKKTGPQFTLPWVTIELKRVLNYNEITLQETNINPKHFSKLLKMVKDEKITEKQAKETLNKFIPKSFDPEEKVEKKISDENKLEKIIDRILNKNKKAVEDYNSGDKNAINFLMGQVMKETKGRADSKKVIKILKEKISG